MRPSIPELAAAMARNGLTGKAVATAAGIAPVTFRSILHHRHDPSPRTAGAIAVALATPVGELGLTISQHGQVNAQKAQASGLEKRPRIFEKTTPESNGQQGDIV